MLVLLVLSVAGLLFLVCQVFALWAPGRAARVYSWAKAFALLPVVLFLLSLAGVFSDQSREGRIFWAMLAGLSLGFFVGAILNLIVCAVLAAREALRAGRASLENVPELGLTSAE